MQSGMLKSTVSAPTCSRPPGFRRGAWPPHPSADLNTPLHGGMPLPAWKDGPGGGSPAQMVQISTGNSFLGLFPNQAAARKHGVVKMGGNVNPAHIYSVPWFKRDIPSVMIILK